MNNSIAEFRLILSEIDWNLVLQSTNPNDAYEIFLKTFLEKYEKVFPKMETKIKTKTMLSPWMTQGLLKSSKRKKRLYENSCGKELIKMRKRIRPIKDFLRKLNTEQKSYTILV